MVENQTALQKHLTAKNEADALKEEEEFKTKIEDLGIDYFLSDFYQI